MENVQTIDYNGINLNYSPYINCFREELFEDTIFVDNENDIEYITKFSLNVEPKLLEVLNTPKGTNVDFETLTGVVCSIKLLVNGRVEFLTSSNTISFYTFSRSYIAFVALPEDFQRSYTLVPKCYVQHISTRKLSNKEFYFNFLVLDTVEF